MKPKKKRKQDVAASRPLVAIPYVEKVSETVARIMKKYNVPCAMKPWVTLKHVLVHPKDREDKEQTTECVYEVPCASCDKTYIGETGRKLGVRPIWILLKQQTVSGCGISWTICKSAPHSSQIITPAPLHLVFLQARYPFSCSTNSIKALKAHEGSISYQSKNTFL